MHPALSKPHSSMSHHAALWSQSTNRAAAPGPRIVGDGMGWCTHASPCVTVTTGEQEVHWQNERALESIKASSVHLSLVINGCWEPHSEKTPASKAAVSGCLRPADQASAGAVPARVQ